MLGTRDAALEEHLQDSERCIIEGVQRGQHKVHTAACNNCVNTRKTSLSATRQLQLQNTMQPPPLAGLFCGRQRWAISPTRTLIRPPYLLPAPVPAALLPLVLLQGPAAAAAAAALTAARCGVRA